jgi:hypothetical protein
MSVYVEPPVDVSPPVEADGPWASAGLVAEDRLQPVRATTSAQPTTARRRAEELVEGSARGRTRGVTMLRG